MSLAVVAVTTLLLLGSLGPETAPAVFRPGELATPHAQILGGTMTSEKCGACHEQASRAPLVWFSAGGSHHERVDQTARCLDCHHAKINPDRARLPHNLSLAALEESRGSAASIRTTTWHDRLPGPAFSPHDVRCAACHREHRGNAADLTAITDAQCQTCHADRFGSFASDHPEWGDWPYDRGSEIAFDHTSHAARHFPASGDDGRAAEFDCRQCHQRGAVGEVVRSPSYADGCRSCHDGALRLAAAEGLSLIQVPSLPEAEARRLGRWPDRATGFYDGELPPLAWLLLRDQREFRDATVFIPGGSLGNLREPDAEVRDAAVSLAAHAREFLESVSRGGLAELRQRLEREGIPAEIADDLFGGLPPQVLQDAAEQWFDSLAESDAIREGETQDEVPPQPDGPDDLSDGALLTDATELATEPGETLLGGDDLLGGGADPLASDDLLGAASGAAEPLASSGEAAVSETEPGASFHHGWHRDDVSLSIDYRAAGHADPVLKAAVELLRSLPESDPIRQRLAENPAVRSCLECHPKRSVGPNGWIASPRVGDPGDLTRFRHEPHLNISTLADCADCHRLRRSETSTAISLASHPQSDAGSDAARRGDVIPNRREFEPLAKSTCAACHTRRAAGESCAKCHRYHASLEPERRNR